MKPVFIILTILFILNIPAWLSVYDLSQSNLEVIFFDIGQGDSAFIKTRENHQILVDGGPDGTILEKLGKEMPFWDRTIDLIILTHPEQDHMVGLIEVLKRYKVENILWTGVLRDTAEYQEWLRLIKEEGSNIYIAQSGQRIHAGGALIEVLHPFESFNNKTVSNTNNISIVARLDFGENSFLFIGDIFKAVERELIKKEIELDLDVLKVAHHGSKTSTAEEFIENIKPEIAVISVGKDNKYGHPHQETLEVLEKYGTNILRTDINGDIKILCNSQSLKLK